MPEDLITEVRTTAPKEVVIIDDRPVFKVVQAGGFATGVKKYEPGELVVWAEPEGWDEKRYGKHWSKYGPSLTFIPVNPPAERLMDEHRKVIADRNKPRPTVDDERFAKLEAMHTQVMSALLEQQAENRRLREKLEEKGSKK